MNLNIFEIWDAIGRQTPFAVRRDHWSQEQYAVIEGIEIVNWPYGKAFGYPITNGERSDRFEYDKEWVAEKVVPCCGCYQWSLAEDVEINKGKTIPVKKKKSENPAYTLTSTLAFGKYKGQTVKAIFSQDPQYILWALVNVDKFFLTEEAIAGLGIINTD